MKKLLLVLALIHSTSYADCNFRVVTKLNHGMIEGQPVDQQRMVMPDPKGYRCIIRYRVQIKGNWETIEGIGIDAREPAACARALDLRTAAVLKEETVTKVTAESQLVCSDFAEIRVHPVRIGDEIFQSEVDMHTVPEERRDFWYKRTQCRMFVEKDMKNSNLWLYQGIICRKDTTPNSKWIVIDKY